MSKQKVFIAMSDGLDSSIAAVLLLEQGCELVGATFRTWDYISDSCLAKNTGCCSVDAIHNAGKFAENHGFEHHVVDLREEFKSIVISDFINEYLEGRTPNPCVVCNAEIKWGSLLKKADELNCDYIATGHYAGIREKDGSHFLINAKDDTKDQTYFLWKLTSEQLKRTLFPLSGYTKDEVRKIAVERGFNTLAKKRESQEICFIPDNDYRKFLTDNVPDIQERIGEGNIVTKDGTIIGKHKGYPFYTIGQRKGLNIPMGVPVYITKIDKYTNTIVIGSREDLTGWSFEVKNVVFNQHVDFSKEGLYKVKIRYNSKPVHCIIKKEEQKVSVFLNEAVYAVTPGQYAVFYHDDELVGGGTII